MVLSFARRAGQRARAPRLRASQFPVKSGGGWVSVGPAGFIVGSCSRCWTV